MLVFDDSNTDATQELWNLDEEQHEWADVEDESVEGWDVGEEYEDDEDGEEEVVATTLRAGDFGLVPRP